MNDRYDPTTARGVHVIVPDAIRDPCRPSGGNNYDRRVCDGLAQSGWHVTEHPIPDAWPNVGAAGTTALRQLVPQIPDGAVVLVDGLIAQAGAAVLVAAARRLSLVLLVHAAPVRRAGEAAVLAAARRVIATSNWLRDEFLRAYPLRPEVLAVAVPGVAPSPLAAGSRDGGRLLCVGAVVPHKGQDVLLAALATLLDRQWLCWCLGSLDVDPHYVNGLHREARRTGLSQRIEFPGPQAPAALQSIFDCADVLVHPARAEGYGMVVTEALAHGTPVIMTSAGGLTEALGTTPDGERPGLVVPIDDADALAHAISKWLTDEQLRQRLRRAARRRREDLPTWEMTVREIACVLGSAP